MRARMVMLIFKKDWRELRRNWHVILPMVGMPLMFSVVFPLLVGVISHLTDVLGMSSLSVEVMIQNLPESVKSGFAGLTSAQIMFEMMLTYFFAPFFLVIPLMASSVVASDSFAGEKERKTIESLLATPISDSELFMGKILVSFIPSMIITVAAFLLYTTVINLLSLSVLGGGLPFPNLTWLALIFVLSPTVVFASIGLTVLISGRVKGFREAQQISSVLLLPILALLMGQITGAVIIDPALISELAAAFLVLDVFLFWASVRMFGRETMLAKQA